MNPESPQTPREQLEARLTALLLGELPPDEAVALREVIIRDPQLAAMQERLKQTIALVRETAVNPAEFTAARPDPLKLSEARRQKLLAEFKTVAPKEFVRRTEPAMMRLVPIAAAACAVVLGTILIPGFIRWRVQSRTVAIEAKLRQLDGAKQTWALENKAPRDAVPTMSDILPYMGRGLGGMPTPVADENYTIGSVDESPTAVFAKRPLFSEEKIVSRGPVETTMSPASEMTRSRVPSKGSESSIASAPATAGPETPNVFSTTVVGYINAANRNGYNLESTAPAAAPAHATPPPARQNIVLPTTMDADVAAGQNDFQPGFGLVTGLAATKGAAETPASTVHAVGFVQLVNRWSFNDMDSIAATDEFHVAGTQAGGQRSADGKDRVLQRGLSGEINGDKTSLFDFGTAQVGGLGLAAGKEVASAAAQPDVLADANRTTPAAVRMYREGAGIPPQTPAVAENRRPSAASSSDELVAGTVFGTPPAKLPASTELPKADSGFRMTFANSFTPPVRLTATNGYVASNGALMGGYGGGGGFGGGDVSGGRGRAGAQVESLSDVEVKAKSELATIDSAWDTTLRTRPVLPQSGSNSRGSAPGQLRNFARSTNVDLGRILGNERDYDGRTGTLSDRSTTESFDTLATDSWAKSETLAANTAADSSSEKNLRLSFRGVPQEALDAYKRKAEAAATKAATLGDIPTVGLAFRANGSDQPADLAKRKLTEGEIVSEQLRSRTTDESLGRRSEVDGLNQTPAANTPVPAYSYFAAQQYTNGGKVAADAFGLRSNIVLPRDYPNSTLPGPVSATYDPETRQLSVITDDKDSTGVGSALANLERTNSNTQRVHVFALNNANPGEVQKVLADLFPSGGVAQQSNPLQQRGTPILNNQLQGGVPILNKQLAEAKSAEVSTGVYVDGRLEPKKQADMEKDSIAAKPVQPPPVPQPEVVARDNAFSTFSLNVSDVSFKLAAVSLEKGVMPEAASIRTEEFINAFDYRDPEPPPGAPVAFAWERARYPFAHNRDLLRFSVKTAAAGRQPGRPLNLVLLLDRSGSMERADRVRIIHEALGVLATQLQAQDKLSVVTFARTPRLWVDGISGGKAGEVLDLVAGMTPEGGTDLESAINLGYATALRHYLAGGVNRVVLLTDGAANLGNVDPAALKQKVEASRKQGIALDCFGIGWEGYNDDLLEVLSRNGDGRYGFINTPEEAATSFAGQLAGALRVAASDVKVQVEFNPRRVISYRQIGYAKHQLTKEQFRDNTVDAAEIGAAESGNALYTVEADPAGDGPVATVRVRYKVPGTAIYREQEWVVPFNGNAGSLEQASPAMRLAAAASAFSEWLASSPFAAEVAPDQLLGLLGGVPDTYGADARPKQLEWMIRQAKSISGK